MENQSFNSSNLASSGVTVTTANPIYVDTTRQSPNDYYLNLDANSSNSEIAAFQYYAQGKGADLGKAGVDGKWGKFTQSAWNIYGNQYLASLNVANTQPTSQPIVNTQPTEAQKKEAAKKGMVWDSINNKFAKAKESGLLDSILGIFGVAKTQPDIIAQPEATKDSAPKMSTGVKIAIGVGAVLVIGGIVYAITKKSK